MRRATVEEPVTVALTPGIRPRAEELEDSGDLSRGGLGCFCWLTRWPAMGRIYLSNYPLVLGQVAGPSFVKKSSHPEGALALS